MFSLRSNSKGGNVILIVRGVIAVAVALIVRGVLTEN